MLIPRLIKSEIASSNIELRASTVVTSESDRKVLPDQHGRNARVRLMSRNRL